MRRALALAVGAVLLTAVAVQAAPRAQFDIGFRATADGRTNVVVRYRVTCSSATGTVVERGRVQGMTPLVRHIPQTLADATSCSIRAVVWDVKPHDDHPHVPPEVRTWVSL